MKKWMKMMAMALMAVAMTVGFAACSSSDDDNNGGGSNPSEKYSATMTINFDGEAPFLTGDISQEEVLKYTEIIITYYDENGNKQNIIYDGTPINKTITYNKLPCKIGYSIVSQIKDNYEFDLSQNYYALFDSGHSSLQIIKGTTPGVSLSYKQIKHGIKIAQAGKYTSVRELKKYLNQNLTNESLFYQLNADGTYTKISE